VTRVHVLVEGQTEETFIRDVLGPHLTGRGIYLTPVLVATKRIKSGLKFKGGLNRYEPFRRDLQRLLGDTNAAAVTTMIDYYGLPEDFPGLATLPSGTCYQRIAHLEEALSRDLEAHRLLPYLSLHEFEALLLAAPGEIGTALPGRGPISLLADEVSGFRSPEEINDGPETHPAARISRHLPGYRKALHGPLIARRIGLGLLRQRCSHFDAWVDRLERLTSR
jgi:hypothetical protein